MSVIRRGANNAFRNTTRTIAIVAILGVSLSLALVMLLSLQAVKTKVLSVQASGDTTITITPAGSFGGFGGGGNPFTEEQATTIAKTNHVVGIAATLSDRLENTSASSNATSGFGPGPMGGTGGTTSLVSSIDPSNLAQRFGGGGALPTGFSLPVEFIGTNAPSNPLSVNANSLQLVSGTFIDGLSSNSDANIGKDLAQKNHLTVGSTFQAYGESFTVKGVFNASNLRSNASVVVPIATEERLSGVSGPTSIVIKVDSVSNISTTSTQITKALGADVVDVRSSAAATATQVSDLNSIKTITTYSLIGAVVAAAIILLLSMLMIVRERRREIGILKAFGSSNTGVVTSFITESLVLTGLGGIVGLLVGIVLANPVLSVLVSSQSTSSAGFGGGFGGHFDQGGPPNGGPPGGLPGGGQFGGAGFHPGSALSHLHAAIGSGTIALSILGVLLVAVLGSAIPSYVIAKVRPAEVLRGE